MRKGGLDPPRYCYRQPPKQGEILCRREPTYILLMDAEQDRVKADASDDSIRTNSHTVRV